MSTVKVFLARLFYPVALVYWKYWSKLYRSLFHRKYRNIELEKNLNLVQASEKMKTISWTKDGIRELWDSCGSPQWVQHVINEKEKGNLQPKGSLDCDDFSSWAMAVVDKRFYPCLFTFSWLDDEKKLNGHAMCLTRNKDGNIVHIGNWGVSKPYKNLREACEDILVMYHTDIAIGWALLDKDLNILKWGKNLPNDN